MKDYKPTVVFDFDGVIHSYRSGWQGVGVIPDPVVPGVANAINDLRERGYMVVVVSTRCADTEGMEAVKRYLAENGIIADGVLAEKPPALCYVDDRAICFRGNAGKLVSQVESFKTWLEDPSIQQADCTEVHLDLGKLTEEQKVELARAVANQRCVVVERNPHPVEVLRPCKGTIWYQREAHGVLIMRSFAMLAPKTSPLDSSSVTTARWSCVGLTQSCSLTGNRKTEKGDNTNPGRPGCRGIDKRGVKLPVAA